MFPAAAIRERCFRWLLILGFPLLGACPAHVHSPPPRTAPTLEARAAEIEKLIQRGSYECLKRAYELGQELHRLAPARTELRDGLARAAVLLALRERQLAILGDRHLEAAQDLLASCAECAELRMLADIADATPLRAAGVVRDVSIEQEVERHRTVGANVGRWAETLSANLAQDPAVAAFYLALLDWHPRRGEQQQTPTSIAEAHAASPLVLFSASLFQDEGAALAQKALSLEPTFLETHLILGLHAMRAGKPAVAEGHFGEALEGLPDSVAISLALADLYFTLEEMPQAIELYQRVVTLAPEHREAHLRKGIALSLTGEPQEAVLTLTRLLDLGNWFLGEAHYWLAWNMRQLEQREEAQHHIADSKHSLPHDPRVWALAGDLALDQDRVGLAEENFLEVLRLAEASAGTYDGADALCESLSSLGQIEFHRRDWELGVGHFEQAGACHGTTEAIIDRRIETIKGWSFPSPREAALIDKQRRQREITALRKARCFYNGAVCALGAGHRDKALELAPLAAAHPAYEEMVETLFTKPR